MSRTAKVKKERPDLAHDEQVNLFAESADRYHLLNTVYQSDGGKELTNILLHEVRTKVYKLASEHKTLKHEEMIGICAEINAFLQTARVMRNAEANQKEMDRELEEALAA